MTKFLKILSGAMPPCSFHPRDLDGHLAAYEMKSGIKMAPVPKAWSVAYPDAFFQTISRENYLDFIIR